MVEQLLAPLNWLIGIAEKLLNEEAFNDKQHEFLATIVKEAEALRILVLTIVDPSEEKAKATLSFDGRSLLSTIVAYTEELLDEIEGELTDTQRDLLFEVRSSAKQLLDEIKKISE
jgi:signal transduction histidine kinase